MFQYIIRRILIAIPVLFGVTVFTFFVINMAPGNPVDMYVNPSATPQQIALAKEQLGLNDPLWVQYGHWLGQLFQGNLGFSYSTREPVTSMLIERLGPTLLLMGTSLIVAYLIAIPLGILSATRQYSWIDYLTTGFSFLGVSIPHFFLGLGAIYIFASKLELLPTGGMNTLGGTTGFGDTFFHMILPVLVLATGIAGNMVRYVRSSMIDVLGKDYLRTARAKGLRNFIVTNKHALRNALIPIITIIGMDIPLLIGGAVVTEQVFQWPGLGQLTIQSIGSRDYSALMALNLIAAIAVLVSNLLTDVVYSIVDPRIKYE
ncbi:ABC transporter permease subunit [Terrilactibacillus sp. BCM23-1]|uniref:ABC transporter permease subunit n=1 Tax=Terrilactibacillus tamarindi TaxID=2599694 RepID=A0A6N8CN28_9BACI|nr:ABC transporter permease [Terrilactibacillus tamarindi]MTT30493.1 ABC transporter permease subunit [Terrilactibacillus tamarindi]